MNHRPFPARALAAAALLTLSFAAQAETASDFLGRFEREAGRAGVPTRGESFFQTVGQDSWSCATCHTRNPAAAGKHASTHKPIEPLAPAANPARFTRADRVDKWFRRNCKDVLGRECNAGEKADVLAWLVQIK